MARLDDQYPSYDLQLHWLGSVEASSQVWESWEPLMFSDGEVTFEGRRAWRLQVQGADGYIVLASNGVIVSGTGSDFAARRLTRIALERVEGRLAPEPTPGP